MKSKLGLTFLFCLLFQFIIANSDINLIPKPVQVTSGIGCFEFSKETQLVSADTGKNIALWLQHFLQQKTHYSIPLVSKRSLKCIELQLNSKTNPQIGREGYQLEVNAKGILIRANATAGLFNGVQSLLQLFPTDIELVKGKNQSRWQIPSVQITDYPRFAWRGLMLDVSRHFFTIDEVKKTIDEMARYKFNILHLHLTDDQGWRIEIKAYPLLTQKGAWRTPRTGLWWDRERPQPNEAATYGGFYTQEQLKDLVRYAAVRNIQIMPEIDVPGHSLAAAAAYPFLSCSKAQMNVNAGNRFADTDDNAYCAGNDSSYQFISKVMDEVAAIFPFEYIHIGGDECNKSFWGKCSVCQHKMEVESLKNVNELQSYFIKRVEKMLESKGKKLMGWDEILEGGLAPNASVMSWRGMQGGIEAAKQNHHVVMTPNNFCYLDLYQGDPAIEPPTYDMLRLKTAYQFEPVPEIVNDKFILGGQGNLWTESVPQFRQAEYMFWPRSLALSEVLWSAKADRNWTDFVKRTEVHLIRFENADINYATSFQDAIINTKRGERGQLQITLDTEIDGLQLYYTFDDTYPDKYSKPYTRGQVIEIEKDANSFGVATYRDGKKLGKIIRISIDELEKRTKKNNATVYFYRNKPENNLPELAPVEYRLKDLEKRVWREIEITGSICAVL